MEASTTLEIGLGTAGNWINLLLTGVSDGILTGIQMKNTQGQGAAISLVIWKYQDFIGVSFLEDKNTEQNLGRANRNTRGEWRKDTICSILLKAIYLGSQRNVSYALWHP